MSMGYSDLDELEDFVYACFVDDERNLAHIEVVDLKEKTEDHRSNRWLFIGFTNTYADAHQLIALYDTPTTIVQ